MLDAKLTNNFEQDFEDSGKMATIDNMLDVTANIFNDLYPLNQRRSKLFAMRQEKEEWTSWSAQFADAWEEAGEMSSATGATVATLSATARLIDQK